MSPQKLTALVQSEKNSARLKLQAAEWSCNDQTNSVALDDLWQGLNFLKALGFKEVIFRTPSLEQIEGWMGRLESYQQMFIQDPEYAGSDEFVWNELNPDAEEPAIECLREKDVPIVHEVAQEIVHLGLGPVPPLMANLAVDKNALRAFLDEVDSRNATDALHRFENIFEEFKSLLETEPPQESLNLLGSVLMLALENRNLEVAVSLLKNNLIHFNRLLADEPWMIRLLEAFEPKASEIHAWAPLFDSVSSEKIVSLTEKQMGTKASHQLVKLISVRVAKEPEQIVQICLKSNANVQRILTQWLAPHWRAKHYPSIAEQLQKSLAEKDSALIQTWLQALLRSYPTQGLEDLKKYFRPLTFWKKFSKGNSENNESQGYILSALQENRSAEILKFLKDIRPSVKGKAADQVEKLISSFRDKKAS